MNDNYLDYSLRFVKWCSYHNFTKHYWGTENCETVYWKTGSKKFSNEKEITDEKLIGLFTDNPEPYDL